MKRNKNRLPEELSQIKPTANKRSETQKAKDRKLIIKLSLEGWSGREMEQHPKLNHISYRQINYDLADIRKEWLKETKTELETFKAQQLQRLNKIYKELQEAWSVSRASDDSVNHNFQKASLDALKEMNKIMGAYAPIQTELSGDIKVKQEVIELQIVKPDGV